MSKDWRKTSEDEDTESIIDFYIKNGILKNPKDYKMGSSLTTTWYDSLTNVEKKVYWDKVGNEWGERFLPKNDITEMNQSEFMDKVEKKINDKKVKSYVDDLETQPTELPINIPSNPFMVDDGDDGIERNELTTSQNMMMMDYLKRKGWSFGDWWKYEGEERIKEHITELRNNGDINYKDEIGWWDSYFKENIDVLGDRLVEEGCSLYKRVYIPMKVRKGEFKDLEKWEREYFLNGVRKLYWDKGGNHIGDNSNPYVKKKKRITER